MKSCVDILLPTCNGQKYVALQIESIKNQSFENWCLLCLDDCSNDATLEVLYAHEAYDERNTVRSNFKNLGVIKSFEKLIDISNGEYIFFCDQDDVWHPDKIRKELMEMHRLESIYPNKPIIVHSDLEVVDADLNTLSSSFFYSQRLPSEHELAVDQFILNNITGCTMLINKAARDLALPIPDEAIMHDWWIAAKVRYHGGVIGFIDEPLVKYRQHESNIVGARYIGLRYFCSCFMSPLRVLKGWRAIYRQAKAIDPDISAWTVFSRKVVLTYRRLKPQKGKEVA